MGATTFTDLAWNTADAGSAYRELCSEADYEHGHSYSGAINVTGGHVEVTRTVMTETGAATFAEWAFTTDERDSRSPSKWGPALGIPVASDDGFRFAATKSAYTLSADELAALAPSGGDCQYAIRRREVARAVAAHGHAIHSVEVAVDVKTKCVVERTGGRGVTVYEVSFGGNRRDTRRFDTQAGAVAYAKEAILRDEYLGAAQIRTVKAYEVEGNTDPTVAATVRRVPVSAKVTVTVTTATPLKRKAERTGWFFYGVASC